MTRLLLGLPGNAPLEVMGNWIVDEARGQVQGKAETLRSPHTPAAAAVTLAVLRMRGYTAAMSITLKVPAKLAGKLEREANRRRISKSKLVIEALETALGAQHS